MSVLPLLPIFPKAKKHFIKLGSGSVLSGCSTDWIFWLFRLLMPEFWVFFVFLLWSDILNELLQRENRVLHFWTMRKRRLDQCQQYVVFERSAKQVRETHKHDKRGKTLTCSWSNKATHSRTYTALCCHVISQRILWVCAFSGSGVDSWHWGVLPIHTHLHRLEYPPHTGTAEGARGLPHHSQGWGHAHIQHDTVCTFVSLHITLSSPLSLSKLRSVWNCWSSWLMASARKATVTLERSKNGWQLWTNATETSPCAWTSTAAAWRKPWASPRTLIRQWVDMCFGRLQL